MRSRNSLETLRDITALRTAQVDLATQALQQADTSWTNARRQRDDACRERDAAADNWLTVLQSRSLDPSLASLSGQWLVDREAALRSATLSETIAQSNRDTAASTLAQRHAELDTSREIATRVKRGIDKRNEEARALELADSHLRKRSI
ncbi:hypothetical protein [Sphingomonas colocasiae]|uniref:Flagellar FliJ protein n=1 Tax=Sphingomonas colocasiae TaxID=1848973 RepID=A0ABS7PW23_9SPHN|nr:hypothetical protein [Sphingomonas colocasiae]MBY8825560.1 hypothetical protein [Sphingomonas colocasiae]